MRSGENLQAQISGRARGTTKSYLSHSPQRQPEISRAAPSPLLGVTPSKPNQAETVCVRGLCNTKGELGRDSPRRELLTTQLPRGGCRASATHCRGERRSEERGRRGSKRKRKKRVEDIGGRFHAFRHLENTLSQKGRHLVAASEH